MYRSCLLFLALLTCVCVWPLAARQLPGYVTICESPEPPDAHPSKATQVETPFPRPALFDQHPLYQSGILRRVIPPPELGVQRAHSTDANGMGVRIPVRPRCMRVYIDE